MSPVRPGYCCSWAGGGCFADGVLLTSLPLLSSGRKMRLPQRPPVNPRGGQAPAHHAVHAEMSGSVLAGRPQRVNCANEPTRPCQRALPRISQQCPDRGPPDRDCRAAGGAQSVPGVHCAANGTRAHRQARQQRGRFPLRGGSTPAREGRVTTKGKNTTLPGPSPPIEALRRPRRAAGGPGQVIADSYPPDRRRSRTKCVRGASRDLAVIMAAGPMNRTSSHISDAAAVHWIIADTYPPGLGG